MGQDSITRLLMAVTTTTSAVGPSRHLPRCSDMSGVEVPGQSGLEIDGLIWLRMRPKGDNARLPESTLQSRGRVGSLGAG